MESTRVAQLFARLAPFWAGEELVVERYWTWRERTRASDRRWLALQCWKEIWGSGVARTSDGLFLGPARELVELFPRIDSGVDRRAVLARIDALREEFAHYCAFADVHDALAEPGEPRLSPGALRGWDEDDRLAQLRLAHKREHPSLGERAARITEGGFGALYRSGMGLASSTAGPHGRANSLIAAVCRSVLDDERRHMGEGWAQLRDDALAAEEWQLLEQMTIAQARARIDMRNAQFGGVLAGRELEMARAGGVAAEQILKLAAQLALTLVGAAS
jgi:hypothetical protein